MNGCMIKKLNTVVPVVLLFISPLLQSSPGRFVSLVHKKPSSTFRATESEKVFGLPADGYCRRLPSYIFLS
ncbi:hypothetical protein QBC32DRAFT_140367 [Pseudoneurospora amorphoporcata]|uniref:Uncharacterized protein n=1 Tax=Pseudoneurospora amorphoporcata TaxID=241081 RepID=A0AAN6NKR5_9PEZI|nr:hypothetical protein QBC32DRAFT_140367 [Pseudoneurospora amorphoporcata]